MKAVVLNIYVIVIIFLTLYVNKKTFCLCDSFKSYIGYTGFTGDIKHDKIQDNFVISSLWADRLKRKTSWQGRKPSNFMLLLLLSNDIETLPGPNSKRQLDRILQQRGINILHQNIRGLLSSFANVCKLIDIHRYIDILTLSETHICDEENIDELYEIPGYKFINRHRTDGKGGGVAICVKDSIKFERRFDLEGSHLENIVIEIFIKANKTKNIIISNCY